MGAIGSVGSDVAESENPDADWDYSVPFYDADWNMWFCTTTERFAKRARPEDAQDSTESGQSVAEASLGSKGDAKAKGKARAKAKGLRWMPRVWRRPLCASVPSEEGQIER